MLARLDGSWALLATCFVFGGLVGSFLNVVIARLPAGESLVWPGSRCPACKTPIRPWHNVPMLSWVMLRGRCAACKAPISVRYPVVELVTATLFSACGARFGAQPALLAAFAFTGALVAITFIDLDIWEVPDEITGPGIVLALLLRPWVFDAPWWSGPVGMVLGASALLGIRWLYFAWRGTEAMGLGDVKLIAMIGAFLGPGALLPVVTLGSLCGSVIGLALLAVPRRDRTEGEEPPPEPWERPPTRIRFGATVLGPRRRRSLGLPESMRGRTHARAALRLGLRIGPRRGFELTVGFFHDTPGWGHFEGVTVGSPPRLWFGPLLGARTADVEVHGDEAPWEPPPGAVPFGPFLALGALATLLLAPAFGRWAERLGL